MSEWVTSAVPFYYTAAKGGLQGPMLYRVHWYTTYFVPKYRSKTWCFSSPIGCNES